ncbi:MAG: hypothetical protein AAFZ04_00720 [Pseudomonadota bacterium]
MSIQSLGVAPSLVPVAITPMGRVQNPGWIGVSSIPGPLPRRLEKMILAPALSAMGRSATPLACNEGLGLGKDLTGAFLGPK